LLRPRSVRFSFLSPSYISYTIFLEKSMSVVGGSSGGGGGGVGGGGDINEKSKSYSQVGRSRSASALKFLPPPPQGKK
jgi:hypothetical protein